MVDQVEKEGTCVLNCTATKCDILGARMASLTGVLVMVIDLSRFLMANNDKEEHDTQSER